MDRNRGQDENREENIRWKEESESARIEKERAKGNQKEKYDENLR